jgi:flagellar biosynthesis/type III secretory pathway protein FliH
MNTFDAPPMPRPRNAPVYRSRGCVLTEDTDEERLLAEKREAAARVEKQREQTQREAQEIEARIAAARREAAQEAEAKIDAMRQAHAKLWEKFNAELHSTLAELAEDIKRQLVDMSMRTAEIILCHRLPDPDMVRSVMLEVLSPISDLQGVRVRIAPGTLEALTGGAALARAHPGIECVEDPDLAPGDVVVESRNGIFDGRIRSRLDQLAEALRQPPVDESAEP